MAKIITDNSYYINIANNLRENLGVEETYKPEEMADKITDVYKAGQDSMVDESKIIPKSTSGNPVYLDDMSEIPHDVGITLTSDSITDFSDVNVTVYGKNLFREDKLILKNTYLDITSEYEGEGIFHVYGSHTNNTDAAQTLYLATTNMHIPIEANSSYTLHVELVSGTIQSAGVIPYLYTSNGTKTANWLNISIDNTANVGTVLTKTYTGGQHQTDAVRIEKFQFYRNIGVGKTLEMDARIRIWLTRSKTTSGYEPSKYTTYTANADGTVNVKSLSPYMSIYSNSDVDISVDYRKSYGMQTEWDRFWDIIQNYGNRTNYNSAFFNEDTSTYTWNDENFKPKYDFRPTNANRAFLRVGVIDFVKTLEDRGITFDSSKCIDMNSTFSHMQTVRLPIIDLTGVTYSISSLFSWNSKLTKIEKIIWGENLIDVSASGPFNGNYALTEFQSEGILPISMSFQNSPLSIETMKGIISCLKDYSIENTGVYTITFTDACKTALEAEGATSPNGNLWTEYVADLGWNLA